MRLLAPAGGVMTPSVALDFLKLCDSQNYLFWSASYEINCLCAEKPIEIDIKLLESVFHWRNKTKVHYS